ncbi:MAG: hydrogenase expression/formation protein HypE [Vulcanimicrobiaceae bacterium]
MTTLSGRDGTISLKHGAGGRAMRDLIRDVFLQGEQTLPEGTIGLDAMDDGAALRVGDEWLVMTTDSYVISPPFFPGGDIGRLAVSGTVNDLAMMGATQPLALTCAVIIEEGFSRSDLERIQRSIHATCREAKTAIVTGDTKVMPRGEMDGIVINTAGVALTKRIVRDQGLQPGDCIIVTGTMGDHGLAVMAFRNAMGLEGALSSDAAPINALVRAALECAPEEIVALKDPTRGGLSSALHEMAEKSGVGIVIQEHDIPIRDAVRAASELLGIDPLHAANEGKAVIGVRPEAAERVLAVLRRTGLGADAAIVGACVSERPGYVVLDTGFGRRLLIEPEGELLPRIC